MKKTEFLLIKSPNKIVHISVMLILLMFIVVPCSFANNNAVMDFNKGQRITLKGKLTNISHNIGSGSCSFILDNSSKVN